MMPSPDVIASEANGRQNQNYYQGFDATKAVLVFLESRAQSLAYEFGLGYQG